MAGLRIVVKIRVIISEKKKSAKFNPMAFILIIGIFVAGILGR
jgi:hypothetical protein